MEAVLDRRETSVNEHYLDHMVRVAETQDVNTTEDIVSDTGVKLLARGARIDARVKDRLLEHKLRKPLEECTHFSEGISAEAIASAAEAQLDRHPMLRALYSRGVHKSLRALLEGYAASAPMQSLLTVYSRHREGKLEHSVGVALLAMGIARQLTRYEGEQPCTMLMAGLFHDVGELYISPALFQRGVRLTPDQWRHIAAHPVVGHRVLKDLKGMGRAVAQIVLNHHERLDGFGYPHGVRGDKLTLDSQILAVSELLVGLIEASKSPLTHADVALKLIPGEFNRGVIDIVSMARQTCRGEEGAVKLPALNESLPRVRRVTTVIERLERARDAMASELAQASEAFKSLDEQARHRLHTILRAFSSTGLDTHDPEELLRQLTALGDPAVTLEFTLILKEIVWRLKEIERELIQRVQMNAPRDAALLTRLLESMKERPAS